MYTYTTYNRYIVTLQTISLRETLTSDEVSYGILLDGCFHCVTSPVLTVVCYAVAVVLLLVMVVCSMRDEFLANPLATFS